MKMVRCYSVALAAVALMAAAMPARAADVNKYLPDDAEMVMVFNVKQLMDSPLVKKHLLERIKTLIKQNAEVTKSLEETGFDFSKDLSSITVSVNTLDQDAKVCVIIDGNFNVEKLNKSMEADAKKQGDKIKVHKEGDRVIYEGSPTMGQGVDKPVFFTLIDKGTMLISTDKATVQDSFARASGSKKGNIKKEFAEAIAKQDGNQSMYMLMLASMLGKSPLAQQDEAKKVIDKLDNVTANLNVTKDVKFGVAVLTKGTEQAKEMLEEMKQGMEQVKGILPLLAGQQKELAPLVDLVNSLKLATEGNSVTIKGEVSEELIEKGLKRDQ